MYVYFICLSNLFAAHLALQVILSSLHQDKTMYNNHSKYKMDLEVKGEVPSLLMRQPCHPIAFLAGQTIPGFKDFSEG